MLAFSSTEYRAILPPVGTAACVKKFRRLMKCLRENKCFSLYLDFIFEVWIIFISMYWSLEKSKSLPFSLKFWKNWFLMCKYRLINFQSNNGCDTDFEIFRMSVWIENTDGESSRRFYCWDRIGIFKYNRFETGDLTLFWLFIASFQAIWNTIEIGLP